MVKVLVVDDYIEIARCIGFLFDAKGAKVVGLARNSTELWKALSEEEVDIVSLDIRLDDENGIDLCREIHEKYPDVFVAMCSAESQEENKRLAKEAGASHFLAKPITLEDVSEVLNIYLSKGIHTDKQPLVEKNINELLDLLA